MRENGRRAGQTVQSKIMTGTISRLKSLSLIIPAYNDETTVEKLLRDSEQLLSEVCQDYEIVVVNDGSRDETLDVLQGAASCNPRIRLINHEVNKGFGMTIRELYFAGTKELVFSLPGDYQYAPKELLKMAEGLSYADVIIGLRIKRNDPLRRQLQSNIYNLLLRTIYGIKYKDVNSIKLFKRSILDKIELNSKTAFVDAELCIRAERAGFKVVEIPIEHLPRISQGASGGKLSVIFETFADLVRMRSML